MRTTNRTTIDLDALGGLFPHRVATAPELLTLGLPSEELAARCRPRGPWQHVLPGILLLARKPPTRAQLVRAALRYGGPETLLTGVDALQLHGMRALPATGPVQVLVNRAVEPTTAVRVTRTSRLPDPVLRRGFLTAPLARAAVDAVKTLRLRDDIRAVLTEVVRHGGVTVADLRPGLARGSEPARQVLAELDDGVRSVPQAWARSVLDGLPLPTPSWGVPLTTAEGRLLGMADAWWPEWALAWQFSGPGSRADLLVAAGAVVLHTNPVHLRRTPTAVAQDLLHAAAEAANRPRPPIRANRRYRPTLQRPGGDRSRGQVPTGCRAQAADAGRCADRC